MGCDIHIQLEVIEKETGRWRIVNHSIDDRRNYVLFAVLANVRNDGNIIPISEPKDIPLDSKLNIEEDDLGYHSYSHLTFEEIFNYNWKKEYVERGVVDVETFKKWINAGRKGQPLCWCKSVSGPDLSIHTPHDLEQRLSYSWFSVKGCYTVLQWSTTPLEHCEYFLEDLEQELQNWRVKPNEIRLVFGFDS